MNKTINSKEQEINDKIEMYKNDIFNLKHCIKRNLKENKRFRAELNETKAKILALKNELANLN